MSIPGVPVLEVDGLEAQVIRRGRLRRAVDRVSFALRTGEALGVLAEPRSGKSALLLSIAGLVERPGRIVGGRVLLEGVDLRRQSAEALRDRVGARVGVVLQEAWNSFDPMQRIGVQMSASGPAQRLSRDGAWQRAREVLVRIGITSPDECLVAYPRQVPRAMRQRLAIAMAFVHRPALVIADEPAAPLDPVARSDALRDLRLLMRDQDTALLVTSQDPGDITAVAQRVCVMYAGRVVEQGAVSEVLRRPAHPYTRGLIDSLPSRLSPGLRLKPLPGSTPIEWSWPIGCAFRDRCAHAIHACVAPPDLVSTGSPGADRAVRCHHPLPIGTVES